MTPSGYALLGLTALVGALIAVVMFAMLRFAEAARNVRRSGADRGELAVLSAALQDAVTKLKAQGARLRHEPKPQSGSARKSSPASRRACWSRGSTAKSGS